MRIEWRKRNITTINDVFPLIFLLLKLISMHFIYTAIELNVVCAHWESCTFVTDNRQFQSFQPASQLIQSIFMKFIRMLNVACIEWVLSFIHVTAIVLGLIKKWLYTHTFLFRSSYHFHFVLFFEFLCLYSIFFCLRPSNKISMERFNGIN